MCARVSDRERVRPLGTGKVEEKVIARYAWGVREGRHLAANIITDN